MIKRWIKKLALEAQLEREGRIKQLKKEENERAKNENEHKTLRSQLDFFLQGFNMHTRPGSILVEYFGDKDSVISPDKLGLISEDDFMKYAENYPSPMNGHHLVPWPTYEKILETWYASRYFICNKDAKPIVAITPTLENLRMLLKFGQLIKDTYKDEETGAG